MFILSIFSGFKAAAAIPHSLPLQYVGVIDAERLNNGPVSISKFHGVPVRSIYVFYGTQSTVFSNVPASLLDYYTTLFGKSLRVSWDSFIILVEVWSFHQWWKITIPPWKPGKNSPPWYLTTAAMKAHSIAFQNTSLSCMHKGMAAQMDSLSILLHVNHTAMHE